MSTSTIDGAIEAIEIRRQHSRFTIFRSIRFRLEGGGERTVKNALVAGDLARKLEPGASGRFYLFSAFDRKGLHGLRSRDGQSTYAWFGNNETAMMIIFLVLVLGVAFSIAVTGDVGLFAVVLLILSGLGWYFYRKGRIESRRQFDSDSGYAVPAGSADPAVPA